MTDTYERTIRVKESLKLYCHTYEKIKVDTHKAHFMAKLHYKYSSRIKFCGEII